MKKDSTESCLKQNQKQKKRKTKLKMKNPTLILSFYTHFYKVGGSIENKETRSLWRLTETNQLNGRKRKRRLTSKSDLLPWFDWFCFHLYSNSQRQSGSHKKVATCNALPCLLSRCVLRILNLSLQGFVLWELPWARMVKPSNHLESFRLACRYLKNPLSQRPWDR